MVTNRKWCWNCYFGHWTMSKIVITILIMHQHRQKPLDFKTRTVQCKDLKFYMMVDLQTLGTSVHSFTLIHTTAHFMSYVFIVYITFCIVGSIVWAMICFTQARVIWESFFFRMTGFMDCFSIIRYSRTGVLNFFFALGLLLSFIHFCEPHPSYGLIIINVMFIINMSFITCTSIYNMNYLFII